MKIVDFLLGKKYSIDISEDSYYQLTSSEIFLEDFCPQENTYYVRIICVKGEIYNVIKPNDDIIKSIRGIKVKFWQQGVCGPIKMVFRSRSKSFATKLKLKMG